MSTELRYLVKIEFDKFQLIGRSQELNILWAFVHTSVGSGRRGAVHRCLVGKEKGGDVSKRMVLESIRPKHEAREELWRDNIRLWIRVGDIGNENRYETRTSPPAPASRKAATATALRSALILSRCSKQNLQWRNLVERLRSDCFALKVARL